MRKGRGLIASFDPTAGVDRVRAFVADLDELFNSEIAEAVSVTPLTEAPPVEALPTPDLSAHLSRLRLSTRVFRTLIWNGRIRTVGELVGHTEQALFDIRNFGPSALAEVNAALAARGLALKEGS
jgi:DNA-directed RNA polymerase alpha subunit